MADIRDEWAAVIEQAARDGLPGPRDLDAALDALEAALGIPAATLRGLREKRLVAVPRSLLETAAEFLATGSFAEGTCMCGSPMEAHDMSSGHSPVDAGDYYAHSVHEQIAATLAAQEPPHDR